MLKQYVALGYDPANQTSVASITSTNQKNSMFSWPAEYVGLLEDTGRMTALLRHFSRSIKSVPRLPTKVAWRSSWSQNIWRFTTSQIYADRYRGDILPSIFPDIMVKFHLELSLKSDQKLNKWIIYLKKWSFMERLWTLGTLRTTPWSWLYHFGGLVLDIVWTANETPDPANCILFEYLDGGQECRGVK